jgi:uncharacterized membrane protein YidH (DUF202 family)
MITNDRVFPEKRAERFSALVEHGSITDQAILAAEEAAFARGVEPEDILIEEQGVSRYALLQTLSEYYGLVFIEYDERLPVPPELLSDLNGEPPPGSKWFPVILDGDTAVIAVNIFGDPAVFEEVKTFVKAGGYEFRVALGKDILWFIQDFLNEKPGHLIGTERTGLAFWRNTLAQWRTRLACYRTDLAKGRTNLSFLRWGLGMTALANTLMHTRAFGDIFYFYWAIIAAGVSLSFFGLFGYLKIRKPRISPPGVQTLVEVTAATLNFLEDYHFIEGGPANTPRKKTMLGRLADFLASYSTILHPSPSYKERVHLARERNVLAAQRTVASCYRTIAARARTGLSFFRTGVAFSSLGFGLLKYFGFSHATSVFDAFITGIGLLMIFDGVLWYWPVRNEQAETPRCSVIEG